MIFLVDYIKEICFNMLEEIVFSDTVLGTVLSTSPISIKLSDKIILSENQLILSQRVSDFILEINSCPEFPDDISNKEDFSKRTKCKVYNSLKQDEQVIMAKTLGGQLYFVLDRAYKKEDD